MKTIATEIEFITSTNQLVMIIMGPLLIPKMLFPAIPWMVSPSIAGETAPWSVGDITIVACCFPILS